MSASVAQRRASTRVALILAVGVVTAGLVVLAYAFHVLRSYELKTIDTRFAIRGATGTPKEVVNVLIDDKTFTDLRYASGPNKGLQVHFPFPRRFYAAVINRIEAAKPRALSMDVQFTEPTDALDDNALILAASRAHHPVFAATEFTSGPHPRPNIFGGAYERFGVVPGTANIPEDADGVVRRMFFDLKGVTSFGVASAEGY